MRTIALLFCAAACGGPVLQNAPKPDPVPIAAGAAAAAAAMTLADPNAATRGKPEKSTQDQEKKPIEVKEQVPAAVFDRLDQGSGAAQPAAAAPAKKHKGPLPKVPSPKDAAATQEEQRP